MGFLYVKSRRNKENKKVRSLLCHRRHKIGEMAYIEMSVTNNKSKDDIPSVHVCGEGIRYMQGIERYLKWAGFKLKGGGVKYKRQLLYEGICEALYSFFSILLICLNEADLIVMWLNLICLVRIIIHNSIYVTETSKELECLNRKQKIFHYYHLKMAVVIAAILVFAIMFADTVVRSLDCGPIIKMISVLINVLILFNNCEELAIYGYDASIVVR